MVSLIEVFIMAIVVAFIVLLAVLVGGFLVFKSKASPGEGFLRTSKGQVFTIPDAELAPDEVDQTIVERTNKFLQTLGG
jgi:hypothetical protein